MSAAQVAGGATTANLRYDPPKRFTCESRNQNYSRLYETSGAAGAASTTRFLYDGDALVAEYNDGGTLLRRYVHGTGTDMPYVWYEGSAVSATTRRHLFANEQGSIALVTNGTGLTVLGKNAYDAYGIAKGAATATSADDNIGRFQYTGQIWLPELGMYYYKARMMSPTLGRFMQTDPIGYNDGMNWYNYVGSDPVNYTDPTGLDAEDDGPIVVNGPAPCPSGSICGDDLAELLRTADNRLFELIDGLIVDGLRAKKRKSGHGFGPTTVLLCNAAEDNCDFSKVNSEVCVIPGHISGDKIVSGDTYTVSPLGIIFPTGFVITTQIGPSSFRNRTTKVHPFVGTTERIFSQSPNGSIFVTTTGRGSAGDSQLGRGRDAVNDFAGPLLFAQQNVACKLHVSD